MVPEVVLFKKNPEVTSPPERKKSCKRGSGGRKVEHLPLEEQKCKFEENARSNISIKHRQVKSANKCNA